MSAGEVSRIKAFVSQHCANCGRLMRLPQEIPGKVCTVCRQKQREEELQRLIQGSVVK